MPKPVIDPSLTISEQMAVVVDDATMATLFEDPKSDGRNYRASEVPLRKSRHWADRVDAMLSMNYKRGLSGLARTVASLLALGSSGRVVLGDTTKMPSGHDWVCTSVDGSSSEWEPCSGSVSVVDFGADRTGVTECVASFNAAIQYQATRGGGVVHVPKGTYLIDADTAGTGSIRMASGVTLEMDPAATLQVETNGLDVYAAIFAQDLDQVVIRGGRVIGDRDTHTGVTGEAGHCIRIEGCRSVVIENIYTADAWGDGVYVRNFGSILSEDVYLRNVECNNARRNGASMVSFHRLTIDRCIFRNTNGANSSGLDVEPNDGQPVDNVSITNTYAFDNAGTGFQLQGISCTLVNCHAFGNGTWGYRIREATGGQAQRNVLTNCFAHNNGSDGFRLQGCDQVLLTNCCSFENDESGVRTIGSTVCNIMGGIYSSNTITGVNVQGGTHTKIGELTAANNGGPGVLVESSGEGTRIGGVLSFGNTGNGIQSSAPAAQITDCRSIGNAIGFSVSAAAHRSIVVGNISDLNNSRGFDIRGNDCVVVGNRAQANNQSGGTFDNFYFNGGTGCLIMGNTARVGGEANSPRYGCRLEGNDHIIGTNDLRGGGSVADFSAAGTVTGTTNGARSGSGAPAVNAHYLGEEWRDSANGGWYKAIALGTGASDWVHIGGGTP